MNETPDATSDPISTRLATGSDAGRPGRDRSGTGAAEPVEVVRSEERLHVATQRVPVEQVRIRRRIVTETRTVEVQVRREELSVEHVPLDVDEGGRTGTAAVPMTPRELVIVLSEEVPVVTTQVRPVELVRVTVGTDAVTQTVDEHLRREQVAIEEDRLGGTQVSPAG